MLALTAFVPDASKAGGYTSRCRDCDRERCKQYYEANREQRQAAARAYQEAKRAAAPKRKCRGCGGEPSSSRHWYCDACRRKRRRHKDRERERRRVRASTTQRGYGTRHQRIRRQWAAVISEEVVFCARCGLEIEPGEPWDLGHDDHDRSRYAGPEHRACNRATAGRDKPPQSSASRTW